MNSVSSSSVRKGSILILSLIVLSLMLVVALTVVSSSTLQQRAALSTENSTRAFQLADSAVELVSYQLYKTFPSPLTLNVVKGNIGATSCTDGVIYYSSPTGGDWWVAFYDTESGATRIACDAPLWRNSLKRIKAQGSATGTSRAVEVSVKGQTVSTAP